MERIVVKRLNTALVCFAVLIVSLIAIEYLPLIAQTFSLALIFWPVFVVAVPLVLSYLFVSCGYYYGVGISLVGFVALALIGLDSVIFVAAAFCADCFCFKLYD